MPLRVWCFKPMGSLEPEASGMYMKKLETINKFLSDESGQTTTEYILILAVIVTIFMQFRKKLLAIINKLFGSLDSATNEAVQEFD